ncbi:MAG TPA: type I DNA topoisomerase [Actinomycetes bacterium]|nr:type I DNA topoisomerase [Actinomycetes bacterium]
MPAGEQPRRLVIVESPAKAKTIAGYLGPDYDVEASIGHIRDLPTPSELPAQEKKGRFAKFAVDVDHGFEPYYVVDPDKRKKVADLRRLLKGADELYLATDEDREGEAIAWHLLQVLEPKVPVRRMVFHEITREAIREAVDHTRDLDQRLVDAQETRRILDRLYGYEVSPVLWRKVRAGLSAGRVQSVATRMVVERERERMAFVRAGYWDLEGVFEPGSFDARLVAVDGARVASGRDFDARGTLTSAAAVALDEASARSLADGLDGATYEVRTVEEKPYRRSPAAPFMTSTLQQEASRKLRMSSSVAMRVAQRLYENGYITYMRTDSTTLSTAAISAARAAATQIFGAENVADAPRQYTRKVKNAQEAHEAIRPSGDHFRTPGEVAGELAPDELALYDLIWKRTVASQMADARGQTVSVRLGALARGGRDAEFGASGTVITHRGFLAAYEEGRDEPAGEEDERRLPPLRVGMSLTATSLEASGHETQPPARYTEATLVKALEERGIGRPSTYASILGVILDRGYVFKKGSALVPSWLAFAVTRLLEQHFGELVDYDFTAQMEEDLDRIAGGEEDRVGWLTGFYFGSDGDELGGLRALVENLGDIDARDVNTVPIGEGITLRVGRYGPYIERGEERASVPEDLAPDELTVQRAEELLAAPSGDRVLGVNPETGAEIVARAGRFGPYVTEALPEGSRRGVKPRTASLFKEMSLDSVTLEDALRLLSLPRVVGVDPGTGEEITAQNGRYGPYLRRGSDSRSLENEDQLFTVTLEEALALYAQPKTRGRGRGASASPLRELGVDPVSGGPVVVRDGRFGPYVTDGQTNATLRSGDSAETVTLERAAELIAEKRSRGPAKKSAAAKKTAAKKTAAKKTAAKKAAATKTSATKTSASRSS